MYGWRAWIGLILPADNAVIEPELAKLDLPGVTFHGFRLTSTEPEEMRRQAIDLVGALTEMGVDAAVYACAETSFNVEPGVRTSLSRLIADGLGKPVVTATNAMLEALAELGCSRVSVVTPYNANSAKAFEQVLEEHGLEVVASVHRDFREEGDDPREWYLTNRQEPTEIYRMARSADRDEADAIVIAATNLPTLEIVGKLEADLGKPVVTSNSSIVRWCGRTLGFAVDHLPLGSIVALEPEQAK